MERVNIDWKNLPFDYYKTDCHLEYVYRNGKWDEGTIVDEDSVKLHISSTCLHYGQEAFEGIKVFEQKDGKITVFRVEENARRMIRSADKFSGFPNRACNSVTQCRTVLDIVSSISNAKPEIPAF